MPGFALGFDHERGDYQIFRVALFYFGDFAEIYFDGAVADQLDVVEAHHADAVVVDGAVTRAGVLDRLADGFPDGAAPAGVERAHHLAGGVGGRAGGEPEGIGGFDAAEFYA